MSDSVFIDISILPEVIQKLSLKAYVYEKLTIFKEISQWGSNLVYNPAPTK